MSPDSLATQLLALAATVAAAVGLSVGWGAIRHWLRPLAVTGCLLTLTATTLIWVNRQVDSYPTWASLSGSTTGEAASIPRAGRTGDGQIVKLTVAGRSSKLTLPVYAYLPPGYAASPTTRYPVVEALHGYPSSPVQWLKGFAVASVLNREIDAGRMAPTVVLFPYQTPRPMLDTECTNLVNGAQAETFLTVDVPAYARAHLPVRTDPTAWGLIGYSAGGYCATDLALRHPTEYTAAASLSGYATPGIAVGNGTERTTYNDLWRLEHLPIPAVSLYLSCAMTDRGTLRDTQALAKTARAPLTVTTSYIKGGGHNAGTWQAMEAPAFDWLSNSLARPVTPPASPTPPVSPVLSASSVSPISSPGAGP